MEEDHRKPLKRRIALGVWLLTAVIYFILSRDYIQISTTDKQLSEYLDYVVQLAGTERRPAKEVRALILNKAEQLSLPIQESQITIAGSGPTLNVFVDYERDINYPGLNRVLYKKIFQHSVKYHAPR